MTTQFTGKVKVHETRLALDAFFKVEAVKVEFEGFDGSMIKPPFEVLNFERGDAVAALVHDVANGTVLFAEQFRYPTYKKTGGWIVELIAGMFKEGEDPARAILRKILEKAGYEAGSTQHISTFYVSPGGTSERIMLYYVPVYPTDEKHAGGGLAAEAEDIRRHSIAIDEAIEMVERGEIIDAKTIIAIQWLKDQISTGMITITKEKPEMTTPTTTIQPVQVFPGGSCNPTTWRKDVAIPLLEGTGTTFYNPQVDDWTPDLVEIEASAKHSAKTLLFVIDAQTRAIASILEATEYICTGRTVVLVVDDIVDGTVVQDQTITGRELKDLNRARAYLRELAARHSICICDSVASAIQHILSHFE